MKVLVLEVVLLLATSAITAQQAPCKHTVTGQLQIFRFDSKIFGNTRMLRVWLPPGYDDAANRSRKYPVLYMFDGQDLFDVCTGPESAYEWQIDETLTRLIAEGKIDPMIVVGIDNAGESREHEYLPWRDVIEVHTRDAAALARAARVLAPIGVAEPVIDVASRQISLPIDGGTEPLVAAADALQQARIPLDDISRRIMALIVGRDQMVG